MKAAASFLARAVPVLSSVSTHGLDRVLLACILGAVYVIGTCYGRGMQAAATSCWAVLCRCT